MARLGRSQPIRSTILRRATQPVVPGAGTATLSGDGSLSTIQVPRPTQTVALSGDGTLASTQLPEPGGFTVTNLALNPASETTANGTGFNGTLAVSSTQAHSGTNSTRVTTTATTSRSWIGDHVDMGGLVVGDTYVVSVWVYSPTTFFPNPGATRYTAADVSLGTNSGGSVTAPANTWTRLAFTGLVTLFDVGNGIAKVAPSIQFPGGSVGDQFYIDDIQVHKNSTVGVPPYFDGATTDTSTDVYDWTGAANASTSTWVHGAGVPVALSGDGTLTATGSVGGGFTGTATLTGSGTLGTTAAGYWLYDYEEGTNGASATGAPGVVGNTGTPTYTTDPKHGSMALLATGAQYIRYGYQPSLSVYQKVTASPGSAASRQIIWSVAGTQQASFRTHFDTFYDLANASGTRQVASSVTWTLSQWYRADVQTVINSSTSFTVTVRIFHGANVEGTTPDDTITATITTTAAPLLNGVGNTQASWNIVSDTLRLYTGAVWAGPYGTTTAFTGTAAFSGTGTLASTGVPGPTQTVPLAGSGTLTTTATTDYTTTAGLSGSGTLATTAVPRPVSTVAFTGTGTLTGYGPGTVLHTAIGAPTADGFVVVSKTSSAHSVRLAVSTSSSMTSPTYVAAQTPDGTGYVRHVATGLAANTQYYYRLEDIGSLIGTVGKARTLPAAGSPVSSFTVAVMSCTLFGKNDGVAHASVAAWDPTFAVHLGDFYYTSATNTTQAFYENLYANMIENYPSHAAMTRDVPTFYIPSDHEAGADNGDSANAWTAAQTLAYYQVLPVPSTSVRYASWVVGRIRFILLDTRTAARSPGLDTDTSSKTMLGATQKQWLKDRLVDTGELKVILSDPGWMGAAATNNGEDKWWSYAVERQEIIDYIANNNVRVALAHGDTHSIGVATKVKNTNGGFPVYCGSPLAQDGGGRNLSSFSSVYNNSSGESRQYMRLTFADNGLTITVTASGWDATNNIERVAQVDTWDTYVPLSGSGTLTTTPQVPRPTQTVPLTGTGTLTTVQVPRPAATVALSGAGTLTLTTVPAPALPVALTGIGTLTSTSVVTTTGTAAFAGSGTLTTVQVPRPAQTVALSGDGTLSTTQVPRPAQIVTLTGTGTLTMAPLVTVTGVATLTGSGALATTVVPGPVGAVTFTGSGTITTTQVPRPVVTVTLTGAGTLTSTPVVTAVGTVAFAGTGTLTPTTVPGPTVTVALSGTGTLVSSVQLPSPAAAVTLTGDGVLSGTGRPVISASVALTGVGNLGVSSGGAAAAPAVLTGDGTLSTAAVVRPTVTVALSGSGTLATTEVPRPAVTVTFTGSGTLAPVGTAISVAGTVALSGAGTLATSAATAYVATVALSGAGSLSTTGVPVLVVAVPLTGAGTLTATVVVSTTGTFTGTGTGTLTATGQPKVTGTVTLSGAGALSTTGTPGTAATATFTGSGTLTTLPVSGVALSGSGTLVATAVPRVTVTVTLTGDGTLTTARLVTLAGQATLAGTGTLSLTGRPGWAATATLTGTGALTATGVAREVVAGTVQLVGAGVLEVSSATPVLPTSVQLLGTGLLVAVPTLGELAAAANLAGLGTLTTLGGLGNQQIVTLTGDGTLVAKHGAFGVRFPGATILTHPTRATLVVGTGRGRLDTQPGGARLATVTTRAVIEPDPTQALALATASEGDLLWL